MDALAASVQELSGRVQQQLRLHAPQFLDYWLRNRDDWEVVIPRVAQPREPFRHNYLVWTEEQLLHILEQL